MSNENILETQSFENKRSSAEEIQKKIDQIWQQLISIKDKKESLALQNKLLDMLDLFKDYQIEKGIDVNNYILYHNILKNTLTEEQLETYPMDTPDNAISKFIFLLHSNISS